MDRIEAMTMFLTTLDTGSFSAAAREMRIPVQTISRNIAELERHLGTRLLNRTTRKLSLTDAGVNFAAAARRIVEQLVDAEREAAGEFITPRGDLSISAPMFFGRRHVIPIVSDFLGLFPEINVRLDLRDQNADLLSDQLDMAIRIGHLPDSGLIATRVGKMRRILCASPEFLANYGTPQAPADLRNLPCIATYGPMASTPWRFPDPQGGSAIEVPIRPRLVSTPEASMEAAKRGIGVVRLLHYQALDAVRSGELRLVLEGYEMEPYPVHLLHASRHQMPVKMRRFLDFAAPRLREILASISDA
jgi:DNA-binding transcriptional LysR family regulator